MLLTVLAACWLASCW